MPRLEPIHAVLPSNHIFVKDLRRAARHMQMAYSTLQEWAACGELKTTRSGYWSTKKIADLVVRKNLQHGLDMDEDGNYTFDEGNNITAGHEKRTANAAMASIENIVDPLVLDAKLKRVKLRNAELDYNIKAGNLVVKNEVEQVFISKIMVLKQRLLTIGREVAPLVTGMSDPNRVRDIIDKRIEYAIRMFADQTEEDDSSVV